MKYRHILVSILFSIRLIHSLSLLKTQTLVFLVSILFSIRLIHSSSYTKEKVASQKKSLNPFFHKAHSFVAHMCISMDKAKVSILFSIRLIHSNQTTTTIITNISLSLNPFFHKAHSFPYLRTAVKQSDDWMSQSFFP